jgi:hypothetical protein
MAVWVVVQLLALVVAASDVSLWARAVEPTSNLALPIVLIVQLVFASLLAPMLFRNWVGGAALIAAAVPFACLAGMLSAAPVTQVLRSAVLAAAWMIIVASWTLRATSPAAKAVVSSVATALTLGLAILSYVSFEFREPTLPGDQWASRAWRIIVIASALSLGWQFARRIRKRVTLSTTATNNCG